MSHLDPDAIRNAEERLATMQSALDDAQRVLQAAEKAQQVAEKSAELMHTIALTAIGGLVIVAIAAALRRARH
jgi:hypothetical protein